VDAPATRRSGGRPTAEAAAQLEPTILDAATTAFLANGYAATTIEAIARASGVAKRTIYARWSGKAALFRAALQRLMGKWLSTPGDWAEAPDIEAALNGAAARALAVALTPEAVALNRLMIAESSRFPELPVMMRHAGAGEGTARIAALLDRRPGHSAPAGHPVRRGTIPAPRAGRATAARAGPGPATGRAAGGSMAESRRRAVSIRRENLKGCRAVIIGDTARGIERQGCAPR
jgi:TetR/AcrR family transcriptional regulator, mexJK operon transcriptional repressor